MSTPEVLLVTGGGRGIGAAIVRRGAQRGYRVCFSYLQDQTSADRLISEIAAAGHEPPLAVRGDVADPAFPERFFDAAEAAFGPVSALVNNAGVTGRLGPFAQVDLPTLRRVLDTNLLGSMLVAQEAIHRWTDRRAPGRIVNISSIAAATGAPHEYVHYAATKAAIEAFTVGLAKELGPLGIRVNAVSPGTTHTDIHAAAGEPDRPSRVVARVPVGRIADPHEIADPVLWLLSPEASYTSGAVLRVAGGV